MRVDDSGNVSSPQGAVAVAPGAGVAPSDAQRPFVDTYLAALLAQASELISGEFHRVVRAHGLSVAEWRVLATLSGGHTLTTGKLAQISLNKGPTATRMLDRMESRGQVERLGDTHHPRGTAYRLCADRARARTRGPRAPAFRSGPGRGLEADPARDDRAAQGGRRHGRIRRRPP
jgi:hypothetical protein